MLLLFPNLLDENATYENSMPISLSYVVPTIDGLIAESEKGARVFLKRFTFLYPKTFRDVPIELLNEHTSDDQIDKLLDPLLRGERWGLISDCGLPCLADPGAKLVMRAKQRKVGVEAFSGPSSIILALMLSGLSAQSFTFHGYLERDPVRLASQLKALEQRAHKESSTQLFIEAPYRSQKMLQALLQILSDDTLLCVAWDLTLPSQNVITQKIKSWKLSILPTIDKKPAVFLFS